MKVLVTGARGFLGKNLCESLRCIRDKKDRRRCFESLCPLDVLECNSDTDPETLDHYCREADFVFNLVGVSRPKDPAEFMVGNHDFCAHLLDTLESHKNRCPVMLASSTQATLKGRFAGSEYGKSKLAAEQLLFDYGRRTGSRTLIYRFPNLFGKWCRPYYNSVVATFCHQVAHGGNPSVNDPSTLLDLLYIDDAVEGLLCALLGETQLDANGFCLLHPIVHASVGEIAELLVSFRDASRMLADSDTFAKKLYATYLSYFDSSALSSPLKTRDDERGNFFEFMSVPESGQVSINKSTPNTVIGDYWHRSRWEKLLVVSGEGVVRIRRVGTNPQGEPFPVAEYRVCGTSPEAITLIPGCTHSVENLSEKLDLITIRYISGSFHPGFPDTYYEKVQ